MMAAACRPNFAPVSVSPRCVSAPPSLEGPALSRQRVMVGVRVYARLPLTS